MSLMNTGDPRRIAEDISPNGNLLALVEDDGRSLTLFLHGAKETGFGVRAVWVRNLVPAPVEFTATPGSAPLMPASACAHPEGASRPLGADLRFLWLEEGDAVALFEGDALLAILPPWSGMDGPQGPISGYARDCVQANPLAAPLTRQDAAPLIERLKGAEAFWRSWSDSPWTGLRDVGLAAWTAGLGDLSEVYDIHGSVWPPRVLAGWSTPDHAIFASVGMSIRPQPRVEMHADDPVDLCRIELALAIAPDALIDADATMRYVAAQTAFPWTVYAWLGPGHAIPARLGVAPAADGQPFDACFLMRNPPGAPAIALPAYRDEPVHALWLIPITASERQIGEELGADGLRERLIEGGVTWRHETRTPVS